MSDTAFTALSTKIRATWLNVVNKLAYYGRSPSYAASTGTANAYVLTLTATSLYEAYVDGDEFTFKANFANTGAATLRVVGASSLANTDIYMGGAALSAGQIQIGDIVKVRYDGTRWQIVGGTPLARFMQSGTGAIPQELQAALRLLGATPEGFGATGDGSADDDAEVDLLEAAHTVGFLPNKSYAITDTTLAAEYTGPGHLLLPKRAHSPMRRGYAKPLVAPHANLLSLAIQAIYTTHGWDGTVSVLSLRPALGSGAYYVDGAHGASAASGLQKTISAISKGNPGRVTCTGHGFTTGSQVYFAVSGMTQLDGLYDTITVFDADNFDITINTTAFSTFTSGTATEPLKKLSTAWAKSDVSVIYAAYWDYNRDDSFTTANPTTSSDSIVILPWLIRRGRPISSMRWNHTAATWTNYVALPNLWFATRSATAAIRDFSLLGSDGEPLLYKKAPSLATCSLTRGSWYLDSANVLYVHTIDERCPDDALSIFLTEAGFTFVTTKTVYVEGFDFHGGTTTVSATDSSGGGTGKFYCKDCNFLYGLTLNGVIVQGMTFAFENCKAKWNGADGFNYRASNSIPASGVEVRCEGAYNGTARTSSGNGSSMHDAGAIIRIRCDHHHNCGPNVVDIGPGSKTLNVGVRAESSLSFSEANRSNFFVQGAASEMWNYDCSDNGSPISLVSDTNAKMYNDRFRYIGTVQESVSGTIEDYVQV